MPAAGADTNDATPTLTGVAGAAARDEAEVTVRVWPGADAAGEPLFSLGVPRSGATWSVDVRQPLQEGAYTVRALQDDSLGNAGASAPRTFRVDTTAPAPRITGPGDGGESAPAISGTAGDAQGDAVALLVRLWPTADPSGPPAHELRPSRSGTSWSTRAPALAPGTWTVVAWGRATRPATSARRATASPSPLRRRGPRRPRARLRRPRTREPRA